MWRGPSPCSFEVGGDIEILPITPILQVQDSNRWHYFVDVFAVATVTFAHRAFAKDRRDGGY